ncbi:MAG: VanZ family protein [Firmicutes bacterium]|mgnify:FL=1|nr:VanZ family protein [Bacillota bacterium]
MIQWAFVVVYVIVMFLFASQEASSASYTSSFLARWLPHLSAAELRQLTVIARKAVHVAAYGVLTLITYYASRKTKKLHRIALPLSVVFALLVAMLDEGYQNRLLYRTGSAQDVLIDGLGIAVTALGLWLTSRWRKQHKEVAEDVENKR